jgi:hypothetical protein
MKLRCALVIAAALLIPAGFASASPIDPSVIINHCLACDAITFSSNSITNPLVITLNSQGLLPTEEFDYTGPATTDLFVALADSLPYEDFNCPATDAFRGCDIVSTVGTPFSDDVELKLLGPLDPGMYTIEVTATPEPSTMLLLLTGGALLIGLGRRPQ